VRRGRPLAALVSVPANAQEFPAGSLGLPWNRTLGEEISASFGAAHGSKVPMRLVSSAKSWLCHAGVDRQAPFCLGRPRRKWRGFHRSKPRRVTWPICGRPGIQRFPGTSYPKQEVVLTVPASFDAAARELTLKAAQHAGLPKVTLLEEPQAALYAWCEAMGESFRKQVRPGEVILVVDVGGGTTICR